MKISDLILEPRFASDLEREYAMTGVEEREKAIAGFYFQVAICSILPILAIAFFFGFTTPELILLFGLHVPLIPLSFWALQKKRDPRTVRYLALGVFLVSQTVYFVASQYDLRDGEGSIPYAVYWVFSCFVANLLMPFRSYVHHFTFVFSTGTLVWGILDYPNPVYGVGISVVSILLGQNMQIFTHRLFKAGMIQRFRDQARYIPKQILMQARREKTSISKVFGPANRFCVCICSDWRKYQSLASQETSANLAEKIGAYYKGVLEILDRTFPQGNYFVDWIADELFVVIFAQNEDVDLSIIDPAYRFADLLLDYRVEFAIRHGYPLGLDVGMSCGVASVGIFGPEGMAKATAFGAVPGQARRLQSVAKNLRTDFGDKDRIVMSEVVGQQVMSFNPKLSEILLEGDLLVKDLTEGSVYVWPNLQKQAVKWQIYDREAA